MLAADSILGLDRVWMLLAETGSALGPALNILYVALGLGLVIFFHELGHFAVAKWCGVLVERFSIGFGPVVWSWKKAETEYALSAIPFGGYVKMLGQDDMDPSQLSSEEIAEDPRSYSAKSVPQRMAIISAGVIMNVITGLLFFALAFGLGVQSIPAELGTVEVGMPAWKAGLQQGDRITQIGDRDVGSFSDIMRGVALSTGALEIKGVDHRGSEFRKTITPDSNGKRRRIGVNPTLGLRLIRENDYGLTPTVPGTPAHGTGFLPGDQIVKLDGKKVASFSELQDELARKRDQAVVFQVQRKDAPADELHDVRVGPNHFKTLGLWVPIGKVAAVVEHSVAAEAGLQVGDKITHVDGKVVGRSGIHPLELPDYIAGRHGTEVELKVQRPQSGAQPEDVVIRLIPQDRPGWIERPTMIGVPLSVPAAGFAFHLIPTILDVEPGSPAEKAGLKPENNETIIIKSMQLALPTGAPKDGDDSATIDFAFGDKEENYAYAFWMIQSLPSRDVLLTVSRNGEKQVVNLGPPVDAEGWYAPTRGIRLEPLTAVQQADSVVEAVQMGVTHTVNNVIDIYLTIRSLVVGFLSVTELRGPIGIAKAAYDFASLGMADLLLFLGFLSVNLAVLNFLPIPVLDGGHMVFLLWEAVTRRKPSEKMLIAATYFGMAFVLALMALVIYLDIFVHGFG